MKGSDWEDVGDVTDKQASCMLMRTALSRRWLISFCVLFKGAASLSSLGFLKDHSYIAEEFHVLPVNQFYIHLTQEAHKASKNKQFLKQSNMGQETFIWVVNLTYKEWVCE